MAGLVARRCGFSEYVPIPVSPVAASAPKRHRHVRIVWVQPVRRTAIKSQSVSVKVAMSNPRGDAEERIPAQASRASLLRSPRTPRLRVNCRSRICPVLTAVLQPVCRRALVTVASTRRVPAVRSESRLSAGAVSFRFAEHRANFRARFRFSPLRNRSPPRTLRTVRSGVAALERGEGSLSCGVQLETSRWFRLGSRRRSAVLRGAR